LWRFLWQFVAGGFSEDDVPTQSNSFRIGRVSGYRRGRVWYLYYHEAGRRRRPRVGPGLTDARRLAAQINGQLEVGAPSALGFDPISIPDLQSRWLEYHEQVARSSVQTIHRYRTATDHLLRFLAQCPVRHAGAFQAGHAEAFVGYLRAIRVSPNGCPKTAKRPLMDKGVRFILECCRALFNYAAKRRHLSPYAENPFKVLAIDRIPVETARPVRLLTADQERAFVAACDEWQFPVFLTLMLTGLRPGELCHLLLPDDLDLDAAVVRVRNKPELGWQVKTRTQREVPLVPELVTVLRSLVAGYSAGPVFRRRGWTPARCRFDAPTPADIAGELARRTADAQAAGGPVGRAGRLRLARGLWWDLGAVREDRVRLEFIRVVESIGLANHTAPKVLRHQFATILQEGRVDPLVRNVLMGHAMAGERSPGHGLGMTAVYTHTRPQTIRDQLQLALAGRPAVMAARARLGLKLLR
jgi:integrase